MLKRASLFISAIFSGEFSEARARHFRYDFFSRGHEKIGATALVTAHHADDQVETDFDAVDSRNSFALSIRN